MPMEAFQLPSGFQIEVIYYGNVDSHAAHLHYKRYGDLISEASRSIYERNYQAFLTLHIIPTLSDKLEASISCFDTLVVLPSSSDDADPYLEMLLGSLEGRDISDRFDKEVDYKAADNAGNPDNTYNAITYASDGLEDTIDKLLIFDESLSSGGSVDAIIRRLLDSGMRPNVKVTLVTALMMKPSPKIL